MHRSLIALFLALATSCSLPAQNVQSSSRVFRWLDPAKDAALFQQIKAAFAEELKPDDPAETKGVAPESYKKISRIGVFESSALVLIAERETATDTSGDYFRPFNYNLKSGKKEAFEKGFDVWKFYKFARFEPSTVPDVVFTYWSCTECEAVHLLGSIRFDLSDDEWKARAWGDSEGNDAIAIGYNSGGEDDATYNCLFRLGEFTGDHLDDLAVRCIEINQDNEIADDTTKIYAVQKGQPQVIAVTDALQLAAIRDRLCTGIKKSELCPPK